MNVKSIKKKDNLFEFNQSYNLFEKNNDVLDYSNENIFGKRNLFVNKHLFTNEKENNLKKKIQFTKINCFSDYKKVLILNLANPKLEIKIEYDDIYNNLSKMILDQKKNEKIKNFFNLNKIHLLKIENNNKSILYYCIIILNKDLFEFFLNEKIFSRRSNIFKEKEFGNFLEKIKNKQKNFFNEWFIYIINKGRKDLLEDYFEKKVLKKFINGNILDNIFENIDSKEEIKFSIFKNRIIKNRNNSTYYFLIEKKIITIKEIFDQLKKTENFKKQENLLFLMEMDLNEVLLLIKNIKDLKNFKFLLKIKNIINFQFNPFSGPNSFKRIIHFAAENPNLEILRNVLKLDNNIYYKTTLQYLPIHFACRANLKENIIFLEELGADIYHDGNIFGVKPYFFLSEKNKKFFDERK